jgi:hypothetical protein
MAGCRRYPTLKLVCLVMILGLTGCAGGFQSPSAEEVVGQRATRWAEALMAQDYESALEMTTPAFRNSPRASRYQAEFAGATWWQDVSLKWVRCEEGEQPLTCEVRQIILLMRPPAVTSPIPIPYDTTWIKLKGSWYVFNE